VVRSLTEIQKGWIFYLITLGLAGLAPGHSQGRSTCAGRPLKASS
jgi:hypothetical protein